MYSNGLEFPLIPPQSEYISQGFGVGLRWIDTYLSVTRCSGAGLREIIGEATQLAKGGRKMGVGQGVKKQVWSQRKEIKSQAEWSPLGKGDTHNPSGKKTRNSWVDLF